MPRLELIMTENKKLNADDARALLSDHLEGGLDEATRGEVDSLLAADPELAAEHRRLEKTLGLLKALPTPEAPADMLGKVRDRLAAERRAALAGGGNADLAPSNVVTPRVQSWRRWGGIEAAIGLAAAASVAVFIAVAGGNGTSGNGSAGAQGPDGTHAAGMAGDATSVTTTIVAPGFQRYEVYEIAAKSGMDTVVGDTYEGDSRAAARFVIALKELGAKRGVEISGFVPDASRVRIEVRSQ